MKFHVYDLSKFDEVSHNVSVAKLTMAYCGPSISYRPQMIELASIPSVPVDEADFYIVPIGFHITNPFELDDDPTWPEIFRAMTGMVREVLARCSHYSLRKDRHVIFHIGDCDRVMPIFNGSLVFKESPCKHLPIFPFYYQTFLSENTIDIQNAKYDVTFQGTTNNNRLRKSMKPALDGCEKNGFKTHFKDTARYFYFFSVQGQHKLRQELVDLIADSKFVMNPKGKGHSSPRFFETIQMGRIPVIVSDALKLPLEGIVPWEKFTVTVPEQDAANAHKYIKQYLDKYDLQQGSVLARETWLKYFAKGTLQTFLEASLSDVRRSSYSIGQL